jgi:hypothetical protein
LTYIRISEFFWGGIWSKIDLTMAFFFKCARKTQQIMEYLGFMEKKYISLIFHFELMMDGLVASINLKYNHFVIIFV